MKNYAIELINVSTPNGDAIFLTNRSDRRTASYLAREIPNYWGEGYAFINKILLADGLSKKQGEIALGQFLAVFKSLNAKTLNTPGAIGRKDYDLIELTI